MDTRVALPAAEKAVVSAIDTNGSKYSLDESIILKPTTILNPTKVLVK